jgi:tellurite resistance protein TerC
VDVPFWAWIAVVAFVLAMLLVDLFVFHREAHVISFREALVSSAIWVAIGLAFGLIIWLWQGGGAAGEYYAGYVIEKSLAVDNIFVFAVVFSYFAVPPELQHRVLFWGVLGALVFRAAFIALGAALIEQFDFTLYVFGAFLLVTAYRMARHTDVEVHPEHNPVLKLLRKILPVGKDYQGTKFTMREAGKRVATPLLAVLVVIETTDIVFAVDSIPAIFAVTRDEFIVFTSNVFAILGLRAMYFMLAGAIGRLVYLKPALAIVLGFVGVKMLLLDVVHVPTWASLAFIITVLTVAIITSLQSEEAEEAEEQIHPLEPRPYEME